MIKPNIKTSNKTPLANDWFDTQGWKAYPFQKETWENILAGKSGLLNAPTGCGKTYAIWFGIIQSWSNRYQLSGGNNQVTNTNGIADQSINQNRKSQLHTLWITPLRALTKEIELATKRATSDLELPYKIALRSGDTTTKERAEQKKNIPQALITTPESVHVLLSQKGYPDYFKTPKYLYISNIYAIKKS